MRAPVERRHAPVWWRLTLAATLTAGAGSAIALANVNRFYGAESTVMVPQAIAQDIVNLAVVVPALVATAILALRGSLVARLLLAGLLAFTVYNYVIYTFAIHIGPLFLLWVAVLGLSLYALIATVRTLDLLEVRRRFGAAPVAGVGWCLLVVGVLFAGLWLKEIVPAVLSGSALGSAHELGLPTNPVQVMDLSVFLPAVIWTGYLVRRRHPLALAAAPGALVFLLLTSLPILVTPVVVAARGGSAVWAVTGPVGAIAVLSAVFLVHFVRASTARPGMAGPPGR